MQTPGKRHLKRLRRDRGQTTAEYALIMAIVCAGCLAAFLSFQTGVLKATIDHINTIMSGL